jgi:hypothetical protein
MKPRTPLRRVGLKKLAAGVRFPQLKRSYIKRSTKPIPQINVDATKRRQARNRKRMRSPEYQAARAGAMERAGGRCELETRGYRCPETERLQFHEEKYPKGRILTADDGKMYCPSHHLWAERQKPHKKFRRLW